MKYVAIGKIVNTFGIKGEVKVYSYTDFNDERFKVNSTVYISEDYIPVEIQTYRIHKKMVLISFKGMQDINYVEKYKDMYIYKSSDDIKPLDDGYYFSDLRDLDVYVSDNKIGKVLEVETGVKANNLRIILDKDNSEHLVPFIPVFVEKVDLDNKRIDIIDMKGLF